MAVYRSHTYGTRIASCINELSDPRISQKFRRYPGLLLLVRCMATAHHTVHRHNLQIRRGLPYLKPEFSQTVRRWKCTELLTRQPIDQSTHVRASFARHTIVSLDDSEPPHL